MFKCADFKEALDKMRKDFEAVSKKIGYHYNTSILGQAYPFVRFFDEDLLMDSYSSRLESDKILLCKLTVEFINSFLYLYFNHDDDLLKQYMVKIENYLRTNIDNLDFFSI